MDDETEYLDLRVATLEAAMREVVAATSSPSERLQRGVERLTDETAGLNALLASVDEQQRRLTAVTRKVEEVDHEAMRRDEVEERICRERKMRRLVTGLSLAGTLALLGVVVYVSDSAHDACERRQEATRAQIEVLSGFKTGGPGDVLLQRGIDRLDDTLSETCGEQYPMNVGLGR